MWRTQSCAYVEIGSLLSCHKNLYNVMVVETGCVNSICCYIFYDNRPSVAQLFASLKGQSSGILGGSIVGTEGTTSLRRVGSMRRTFVSGQAGLKKKSICLQVKFNVVSNG